MVSRFGEVGGVLAALSSEGCHAENELSSERYSAPLVFTTATLV